MPSPPSSPAGLVQVVQGLVARELVEGFGLPERQAALRLGLVPSAVSQYLSGKRLSGPLKGVVRRDDVRRIGRRAAQDLVTHPEAEVPAAGRILEAALELGRLRAPRRRRGSAPALPSEVPLEEIRRALRARVAGEQAAVADCMRLAQRSRDELTRAIFRQIASDSLRHAEIVASLETYLDRGVHHPVASGVTLPEVERLIAREHDAEAIDTSALLSTIGGVMRLLWDSMEADERKHDELLQRLRSPELLGPSHPAARARGARAARARG